jgi:hypothetical protein
MQIKNSKFLTNAILAVGFMMGGFTASAATISLVPVVQIVPDNTAFSVDVIASGLPAGTSGGGLDFSWVGNATLNSVYLATTDLNDSNGTWGGNWDPVSSFFSGPGTIDNGTSSLTGLYVGSFAGLEGFQQIARLNFTTDAGFSGATISVGDSIFAGPWSYLDAEFNLHYFTNVYSDAEILPPAVPVPAALWLFGSGLIGLVGVARRRV